MNVLLSAIQIGPAYFEEHYIKPIVEMMNDPVQYAAYRQRVEEGLKTPAEVQRAKDVDAMFERLRKS